MKGFYKKMAGLDFKIKFLIALCALILVSMLASGSVKATYQSRNGFSALVSTSASDFFINIRKMETSNGPMGLNATLESDYTDSSANGIDVHMMKNSEWGATIMLAISGYGGGSQDDAATYTTGSSNYTGVYGMGNSNWEYMATTTVDSSGTRNSTSSYYSNISSADSRYFDLYYVNSNMTSSSQTDFYNMNYKTLLGTSGTGYRDHYGDAIYEVQDMYTGAYNYTITVSNPFFRRGYSSNGGVLASSYYNGEAYSAYTSRAVVVCGSGL